MRKLLLVIPLLVALRAGAVSLATDGVGQALIFPYFTAQSTTGNAFNSYVSIVNSSTDAKAVRVRLREGRTSIDALSFNLFLSPGDVWAAAIVPTPDGARVVTMDVSCTDPVFDPIEGVPSLPITRGFDPIGGSDVERRREGFIEVLEMAVLTGASATAVTHTAAGPPANCAAIRSTGNLLVSRPTGGLSGTLTLINVASGLDFTLNAVALADLAQQPFYRPAQDSYPDFNAVEIGVVSDVTFGGEHFRSRWRQPADAVSAVLMRAEWLGEYTLDPGTRSLTDFVLTFPTRHFYVKGFQAEPPFSRSDGWSARCPPLENGVATVTFYNREERLARANASDFPELPNRPTHVACASAAVFSVHNGASHMAPVGPPTAVLGSRTAGFAEGSLFITSTFSSGWLRITAPPEAAFMTSLPDSLRWPPGASTPISGAHRFMGQPIVGFTARIFRNDGVSCSAGICQGNYGGAFPLRYVRSITPAP